MNSLKYLIILIISYSVLISAQSLNYDKFSKSFMCGNSINYIHSGHSGLKVNTEILKIDSIMTHSIEGGSGKNLFAYNQQNKISEWLNLGNAGYGWENNFRNDFYYDNSGNKITEINLDWNMSEWDSTSRIVYSYNNDKLVREILKEYANPGWVNLHQTINDYDSSGNLLHSLNQWWETDHWVNSTLISHYYSNENTKDSIIVRRWIDNDWQNYSLIYYYYAANDIDLDSSLAKSWNSSSWINDMKTDIVNDNNHNQIKLTSRLWTNNTWLNNSRLFYTYNSLNYIETASSESWDGSQWISSDDYIFFENPDGFATAFHTNHINAYYTQPAGITGEGTNITAGYQLFPNYPNPFNPSTVIKYKIPSPGNVEIKVYDLLGRELAVLVNRYQNKGIHTIRFRGQNLPSGVYLYRIIAAEYSECRKMILQK